MKTRLILVAAGLALLTVVGGCKKSNTDPNNGGETTSGKYLKKVNYWTVATNKETTIRELVLNANGDITALRTYTSNAQGGTAGNLILEFTSIEKNSNGKVAKISGQDKQQNIAVEHSFTYDASGNLTKAVLKQSGADFRTKNFNYDASNRLIFEDEIANNNSNKVVREKSYTYTGTSANPTTMVDNYVWYNTVTNYTLTFDDKKNPSQAAPAFLYPMNLVDFYKSNLLKSDNGKGVVLNYTLTYNSDGFAASTTSDGSTGFKFEYGD